jgi:hypothetical protein
MKLVLILLFTWMVTDSLGQSLEQILKAASTTGENLPSGVYVSDLCNECDAYGLSEFKVGDGNMFDKRSYRDFRIITLEKKVNHLNALTDKIENCSVMYILYVDKDVFLNELKQMEDSKIKSGDGFISKEPFLDRGKFFDLKISVIKWPFREFLGLRYGFLVITYPAQKL